MWGCSPEAGNTSGLSFSARCPIALFLFYSSWMEPAPEANKNALALSLSLSRFRKDPGFPQSSTAWPRHPIWASLESYGFDGGEVCHIRVGVGNVGFIRVVYVNDLKNATGANAAKYGG